MRSKILALFLLLAACSTPSVHAPVLDYPTPPAALMEPSQNLQTIPTENTVDDNSNANHS